MEETIECIEQQLIDLEQRGLLRWIYGEEQQFKLFDNNLFLEILKMHGGNSKVHSFLINGKDFHFILYHNESGDQVNIRFIWDCERRIEDLANFS